MRRGTEVRRQKMEASEYEALGRLEETHWWLQGMGLLAQQAVARLNLAPHVRILDAGCGTGGNLLWLGTRGRAIGIDSSPLALGQAARKAPQCELTLASISALPFLAGSFQLATCFDVIYHQGVPEDRPALQELWRSLAPGGWLVLRVPAHNWLRRAHDERVHTARRYSPKELREKLEGAGFRVVHLTAVGLWLLPGAVVGSVVLRFLDFLAPGQLGGTGESGKLGSVIRVLLHRGRDRPASLLRLPPAPVNWLLGALLRLEGRWAARGRLPWGLSLFAVTHKPVERGA